MNEDKINIRVVRSMGRDILESQEKNFVPLPITDDRDFDYIDPQLKNKANLVLGVTNPNV